MGPGVVALIAMALLMPRWLATCNSLERRYDPSIAASGLVGAVLLLFFLTAALIGGVLASPRADLAAEFTDVMSGVLLPDLLRATLRSAVFLAVLCSWCQWRGRRQLKRGLAAALVSSDLMVEGLMLLFGLKFGVGDGDRSPAREPVRPMTNPEQDSVQRDRWLFVGSGLVLISAVLVGLAREQRWGQPMVGFRLLSQNATGLRSGQEVRISGIAVGRVGQLQLQPNANVAVEVQVAQRYAALIGPKSVARAGQEGFVGDHYLEISADPQPAVPDVQLPRQAAALRAGHRAKAAPPAATSQPDQHQQTHRQRPSPHPAGSTAQPGRSEQPRLHTCSAKVPPRVQISARHCAN